LPHQLTHHQQLLVSITAFRKHADRQSIRVSILARLRTR